ncbi:hypothetical protein L7F22_042835 [Adiantum nelumboides]|nr:hypothetical protein [Adiantum nelumboides]
MATEDPMRLMAASSMQGALDARASGGPPSNHDSVTQELGILLRSHSRLDNILNKRDVGLHRSGSAPPSVEGSLASMGGLYANQVAGSGDGNGNDIIDSEQELRSDPAYLAYYYSHVNLNPRLPPPLVTRENYVLAQRLAAGGLTDKRKLRAFDDSSSRSLFATQPMLPTHTEEPESEEEKSPMAGLLRQVWGERGADGATGLLYANRPKSLVDLIQEDFPRTPSPVFSQLRPPSRTANEEGVETDGQLGHLREPMLAAAAVSELNATLLGSRSATPSAVLGSRSATPNPGISSRSATPNPGVAHIMGSSAGSSGPVARLPTPEPDVSLLTGSASMGKAASGLVASMQSLNLGVQGSSSSEQQESQQLQEEAGEDHLPLRLQHNNRPLSQPQSQVSQTLHPQQHQLSGLELSTRAQAKFGASNSQPSVQPTSGTNNTNNMYAAAAAAAMSYMAANPYYQGLQAYAPHYGLGGYMNPALIPVMMANYPAYDTAAAAAVAAGMGARAPGSPNGAGLDMQQLYKYTGQAGASMQSPLQDPLYYHYLQQYSTEDARNALNLSDPSLLRGYPLDSLEMQKNHLNSMFGYSADQKSQLPRSGSYGLPLGSKPASLSPAYYGSPPTVGFVMPYGSSPISSPMFPNSPLVPSAFSLRQQADRNFRFSLGGARTPGGGAYMSWQGQKLSDGGEDKGSSLLEELKNNKTRRFELGDIAGHVVEFSADQHGSRFIQQKLEMVSLEEKASVFQEVLPHALTLMTDVFGNYVIQKFFEHGTTEQRTELAERLVGHALNLSLQMYGCRVIQKALEVVDMEQQIRLISELDGHVMRCVRDQNGNHVIQKCIECVPPDRIGFILSAFYGQVVMLSTHPYGCRVIQRVLEYCTDEQKGGGVMDEILRSVCTLAQDQYGNYVVQHILEHGKPEERSDILTKMAGQIVQMSQHKFASNVVEKCLEFGGPAERQILITEMLGQTDENEPLQAMMKDQYANYVVQKVLETCNDQQREMLLSRIRVHLHALKKYTYGKHIVARVEKLVAAGERRGAMVLST